MTFKTSEAGASGAARAKAIAAALQSEIERLKGELLSPEVLGRTPTAIDAIAAEALATATVRSRHLRLSGRNDRAERQEISALLRDGPFRMVAAA
jgi:HPt (histidine-containing phosphotransfer) domain-containing protein